MGSMVAEGGTSGMPGTGAGGGQDLSMMVNRRLPACDAAAAAAGRFVLAGTAHTQPALDDARGGRRRYEHRRRCTRANPCEGPTRHLLSPSHDEPRLHAARPRRPLAAVGVGHADDDGGDGAYTAARWSLGARRAWIRRAPRRRDVHAELQLRWYGIQGAAETLSDADERAGRPALHLTVGEYIEEEGRAHSEGAGRIGSGLRNHTDEQMSVT
jgi:hypothetical protein